MTELDVATQERLAAVTERRQRVLAGALDALALARTNAARSAHGLEIAAAGTSAEVSAAAVEAEKGGWGHRPDTTEIVVGDPDAAEDPSAAPVPRTSRSGTGGGAADDEVEGRDWLR
ncbi:hypothetical protein RHODO2019_02495 [Rhodococcus antarcticus]|uniref:Uncharacterized protein n=1 Tax=Rhodococcus antarcticus TaxID=2987751 RepID=A0ABY6P1G9_9NOCA|nr:hypothetical protein [Rhodococcus antarcticus]UZJ25368.1 hypothetical protein RHODO2019_02495 [Rhodococcus antarcticus]